MAKVLVVRVHQFDRSVSSSMKVLDAFYKNTKRLILITALKS